MIEANILIRSLNVLCRYAKPISVARRVLDHPSLSMLVGGGATQFAEEQGFSLEDNDSLLTQQTRQAYQVLCFYKSADVL